MPAPGAWPCPDPGGPQGARKRWLSQGLVLEQTRLVHILRGSPPQPLLPLTCSPAAGPPPRRILASLRQAGSCTEHWGRGALGEELHLRKGVAAERGRWRGPVSPSQCSARDKAQRLRVVC